MVIAEEYWKIIMNFIDRHITIQPCTKFGLKRYWVNLKLQSQGSIGWFYNSNN